MLKIRLFFKKKRLIYVGLIVGTIIGALIIFEITGVSTENTWLGAVSMTIIFLTIAKILHNILNHFGCHCR